MIPVNVKWDPNGTPPQFTDNEDYRIEAGSHIRVKVMGTRSEVGEMWAIGTINEDYLGYTHTPIHVAEQLRRVSSWLTFLVSADLSGLETVLHARRASEWTAHVA